MGDGESSGAADDENASSGLPRIVWFRQMVHRWQSSSSSSMAGTAAAKGSASDSSASGDGDGADPDAAATPAGHADSGGGDRIPLLPAPERRRLPRVVVVKEQERGRGDAAAECESPMTPATPDAPPPADVPRGCCPVYVGAERRRFVVPTAYLGMPVFRRLLEKAEEEFEFDYRGGAVTIPCDTEAFKYILVVMDRHRQGLVDDEGNATDGSSSQS